jgi:hypothetical protein
MVNTTNYNLEKYEAGRTGTETFNVTDLSKLKKTEEGFPIPSIE